MKQCEICCRELNTPWYRWRAGAIKDLCGKCFFEMVNNLTKPVWEAQPDERKL